MITGRSRTITAGRSRTITPGSLPPLQYRRLGGLAVGILAVVVVLVLLARGCSGSSSSSKNVDYFNEVQKGVLTPSNTASTDFHKTLDLASGTKLSVEYSPVDGGWHYVVTARTACLPTE